MKPSTVLAKLSGAALLAGAFGWAIHQQFSYVLAGRACSGTAWPFVLVTLVAVGILAAGVVLSRRSLSSPLPDDDPVVNAARQRRFLAVVGFMGAALFLFAIALQVGAELMLAPCAK